MPGHLFLVRGDLRHLACDAVLVPSGTRGDHYGEVPATYRDAWDGRLDLDEHGFARRNHPGPNTRVVRHAPAGSSAQEPALWLGHTGHTGTEAAAWFAKAVDEFIREASDGFTRWTNEDADSPDLKKAPLGDPRPLLALPLVGVGGGARGRIRGEIMEALVTTILDAQRDPGVNADVALVLWTAEAYSAAQQARKAARFGWSEVTDPEDTIPKLAALARRDRLVLFFGAGASMGAGLPSWKELLAALAAPAKLKRHLPELRELDARDAAALIQAHLAKRDRSLPDAIAEAIAGERASLVHLLLASLPVTEAVTTNYDGLFELAWEDALGKRKFRVLPRQSAQDADRWLLKLHGDLQDPKRLVFSRNDYLRFEGEGAAFAGVVQAMLLTRHMLFVGYSLSDDNFHRLAHQARAALGASHERPGREPFGTALTPEPGLAHQLWDGDVRFLSGGGSRRVAIVLDRIGSLASAPSAYLLNGDWDALLSDDEKAMRARLLSVRKEARHKGAGLNEGLLQAIEEFLGSLGGGGSSRAP